MKLPTSHWMAPIDLPPSSLFVLNDVHRGFRHSCRLRGLGPCFWRRDVCSALPDCTRRREFSPGPVRRTLFELCRASSCDHPRPASLFNSAARDMRRRAFANKPARRTGLPRTSAFGGTARLPARRDTFYTDPDVVVNILRTIGKLFEEYWCNGVSSADIAKTFRYIR